MLELRKLIDASLHFGHKTSFWSPKMSPFIWGQRGGIHLIDVSKTALQLEKSAQFLKSLAAEGKTIMWIGTKKAARSIIQSAAHELDQPYVTHRWIGGTLTNHSQVKKSVTKLLHYEDILSKSSEKTFYTKKELNSLQKAVNRLKLNIGGIQNLKWPVAAIVIIDVNKEQAALKEAASMGIPVIGLVDTNSDPSLVEYVIPGNDDAPKAIKCVVDYLAESVAAGKKEADARRAEEKKAAELKRAEEAKARESKKEAAKPAAKAKAEEPVAAEENAPAKKAAPKAAEKPVEKAAEKAPAKKAAPAKAVEEKKTTKKPAAKKPAAKTSKK